MQSASDGLHGIARLMNQPFDVLVTDIYMPGADGIQIIRECRRLQPTVKIVPISGRGGPLGYAVRRPVNGGRRDARQALYPGPVSGPDRCAV